MSLDIRLTQFLSANILPLHLHTYTYIHTYIHCTCIPAVGNKQFKCAFIKRRRVCTYQSYRIHLRTGISAWLSQMLWLEANRVTSPRLAHTIALWKGNEKGYVNASLSPQHAPSPCLNHVHVYGCLFCVILKLTGQVIDRVGVSLSVLTRSTERAANLSEGTRCLHISRWIDFYVAENF